MLRRAENVQVHLQGSVATLFSGRARMVLRHGKKTIMTRDRVHKLRFAEMAVQSQERPVLYVTSGERRYWRFQDRWFWDSDGLDVSQVEALLVTRQRRETAYIDRAKDMVAMAAAPVPTRRGSIPADVRQLVWQRDRGACRGCGTNVELQFDHVIPVSFGGSSEPGNLQILCGPCNRRKGASVR